jgi:hypothetical protein
VEHLRLQKRAVLVHFAADLPVGVVEAFVEQRDPVGVPQRAARYVVVSEPARAAVAASAHLDLARGPAGRRSLRVARFAADRPGDAPAIVQRVDESLPPIVQTSPVAILLRPRNVIGAGAVTRLAGDVDLRIARGKAAGLRIEILPNARRVARRAHVVPVLARARPVQRVTEAHVVARIEVKPALPALRSRPRVPRDGERLEAPVGELEQILLERSRPEGVLDVVVAERAVGAVRAHHELPGAT